MWTILESLVIPLAVSRNADTVPWLAIGRCVTFRRVSMYAHSQLVVHVVSHFVDCVFEFVLVSARLQYCQHAAC